MAAPPPVLTLAVTKGPREGDTRQCRAGAALRVGRVASGNDLAVRDAGASQRHLAIEFLPPPSSRWAVSDLGSSNGTLLNGAPLVPAVPAPLSDGDLIKIGEDTVLAISIDSDPNKGANPGPRRSSRHPAASAAVEEKPQVATRRGGRKKAAAEPPNGEKEKPDAAEVVEAAEKAPVAPGRGGRKIAAAPAEATNAEKEEHAVEVEVVADKPAVVLRRGGRRKAAAVEPSEAGTEEPKEAAHATRRGGRRKAAEPPVPEKEEEEEEKEQAVAAVVTRRGRRKKDAAIAAPPPPPVKTRSGRGQGRHTRASARKAVDEDEDEEEQEVAAATEVAGNLPRVRAAKGGDEEEPGVVAGDDGKRDAIGIAGEVGHGVAAGDGEQEGTTRVSQEEEPVARSGGEVGGGENVEARAGRSSLETMTLREWFERMEKYIPRMINMVADEMIASLEEKHRRVDEYISTLEDSSGPA